MRNDKLIALIREVSKYNLMDKINYKYDNNDPSMLGVFSTTYKIGNLVEIDENIVDKILESDNIFDKVRLLYFSMETSGLDSKIRDEALKYVFDSKNKNAFVFSLAFIKNSKTREREDLFDIYKTLLAIEEDQQAICAGMIALNKNILKRKDAFEIINITATAKMGYQADEVLVATNCDAFSQRENMVDFLKIIANARGEAQSSYASFAIHKDKLLEREDALEIIELIATAEENYQAQYACSAIKLDSVVKREDALEIIKRITTSNEAVAMADYYSFENEQKKKSNRVLSKEIRISN